MKRILMEMSISDILLELIELDKNDITQSDLQGIVGAKTKMIIASVKYGN